MTRGGNFLWMVAWWLGTLVAVGAGQVVPLRAYVGVNRSIPVRVDRPEGDTGTCELRLLEPRSWRAVERATVEPGELDLAEVFPVLWTTSEPRLLYLQLSIDGKPTGSPVIVRPLLPPPAAVDELSARLRDALLSVDPPLALNTLAGLARTQREAIAAEVRLLPAPGAALSGLRLSVEKRVRFETTLGAFELELRPDAAPNTCEHVAQLVEGGFYDGVVIHRVVGIPGTPRVSFVQTGDPTGTGEGQAGVMIDFEPSPLKHDVGVVSMARREGDPNSASSQFLICMDRESCRSLDGRSTAFAEVVSGMDVVEAIGATPLGARDEADPLSPRDRPVTPPVIERAVLVPAPPAGARPVKQEEPPPVTR